MTLAELFLKIPGAVVSGDGRAAISGVTLDSRSVKKGDLFIALKGAKASGECFAADAIRRGAAAVAADERLSLPDVPTVFLPDARARAGVLASVVYGAPTRRMTMVGITGTNGKTTTAHLIEAILKQAGRNPAYVGTVGYRWNGKTRDAERTTPEAPELQAMFRTMADERVTDVVMECSSHGLELGRLNGVAMDVAVFTNLTQDHLDFHGTLERYRDAKWKLFGEILADSAKPKRCAVFNLDDPTGAAWMKDAAAPKLSYSVRKDAGASVYPETFSLGADGIQAEIRAGEALFRVESPLAGAYNLSNILAAVSACRALGVDAADISSGLRAFSSVPGRLERIENSKGIHVFVDYAHTEDALENVLRALKPLRRRRLIAVFGCGGDRDRGKRPRMAGVVARNADVSIVTSDNPRSENPDAIVREVMSGIPSAVRAVEPETLSRDVQQVACSMTDRRAAIERALHIAAKDDIVLIAGKGHETYQEIAGVKHPFDDREVARAWFGRNG